MKQIFLKPNLWLVEHFELSKISDQSQIEACFYGPLRDQTGVDMH
jgi:hypothetical protein